MCSIKNARKVIMLFGLTIIGFLTFVFADAGVKNIESDLLPNSDNILDETYLSSNQFTQADDLTVVNNYLDVPSTYLKVGENNNYTLYMEEDSQAIRVVNKSDGFIYGSSISTKDDNLDNFNTTWEGIVNSAVTIKYYDYNSETGIYTTQEESLLKDPESTSSYTLIENGFEAELYFGQSGISLTLRVYLEDEYLTVNIPNESISEGEVYKLRSLKVFPFMGAVYANSLPGYIMVPDGSGALIRYQDIDVHRNIYEFRYYGQDNSVQAALENEPRLAFPVSGMVHGINQHGFIAIVEEGAEHGSLVVSPAKRNLKYYYSYNEFTYRQIYQTPLSESDAANQTGRLVIEENINDCDVIIRYQFLSDGNANYVGMANAYRNYLKSEGNISDRIESSDAVDVFIDIIGSETKEGFIFDEYLEMTSINQVKQIIDDLLINDIQSKVVYKGYDSRGLTSMGMVSESVTNKLGTKNELESLLEYVETNDISLYFQIDPVSVYEDARFSLYRDATRRINQNLLVSEGYTKTKYFISPSRVENALVSSIDNLNKSNIESYALESIGYLLNSHYPNEDNSYNRREVKETYQSILDTLSKEFLIYQANDYMLKYTTDYLLTPMSSSRYRIYSDTVPFVPFVLQGLMKKYSPYQNFSSSSRVELLKMVDYGVLPSYLLTWESAYQLQSSELQQIYSSSYQTWQEKIVFDYNYVYEGLDAQMDTTVVSRTYLDTG
ncbi:MAG: hypothetical protein K9L64_04810, partial [Candidatus Izimaplasma sp.]|nr:hypothetical protein [Candidatus Izimaplasma bacterium]